MGTPVLYVASNPPDGVTTYQNIRIERAPDNSGVPGVWSLVTTVSIDSSNENTSYTDNAGSATTDWYHHRWETTDGVTKVSAYSTAIQAGDSIIRQWIKGDVPDTDLTITMWDRWRDQAFQEMAFEQLGRPANIQTLVPSGTTTDQWFSLNSDLRTVTRVDMYSGNDYVGWTDQWEQRGRQIRLFFPENTLTYKVYAIGELRNYGDIDDELFMLVYWLIRRSYLDYRIAQRANWKLFQVAERPDDTSTQALIQLRQLAGKEVADRIEKARRIVAFPARGH